jgi:hypothetical protein
LVGGLTRQSSNQRTGLKNSLKLPARGVTFKTNRLKTRVKGALAKSASGQPLFK